MRNIPKQIPNEVWEMFTTLEILLKEVDAREVSEMVKASTDNRKPPFSRPPSATAMTTQNDRGRKSIQCVYCKEFHFSASCDRVTAADQRKEILRRDNRCFYVFRRTTGVTSVIPAEIADVVAIAVIKSICPRSQYVEGL